MRIWKTPWKIQNQGWLVLLLSLAAFTLWLVGCTANEPFDPDVLDNRRPVARLFVTPDATGDTLNATSYFERKFAWSGSDVDGFVVEFYVSILTEGGGPAVWDTTTSTDTTMTFAPDPLSGEASATIMVACLDNRGDFSDTLSLFVPMRNYPPVVDFQPDYDPNRNLQRAPGAEPGTYDYWNWGPMSFRLGAYDTDGLNTMNTFCRYTLAEGDPEQEWNEGAPGADPEIGWIRKGFDEIGTESHKFDLFLSDLTPGQKTLTISVQDEAGGDAWFQYSWEVRAPKNSILYFPDNSSSTGRALYEEFLNQTFGVDNWDQYDFVFGYPDNGFVLAQTLKMFDVVLWVDGGSSTSGFMQSAFSWGNPGGPMKQYLDDSGRLLLVSKLVTELSGDDGLPGPFVTNHLGINHTLASPRGDLVIPAGKRAMPVDEAPHLPVMYKNISFGSGRGLDLLDTAEALYRLEPCVRCYNQYDPWDPVVALRLPPRLGSHDIPQSADVVCFSLQLEYFAQSQVISVLQHVLNDEMGVITP